MYSSVVGQLDFGRGCVIGLLLLIPALCSSVFELLAPRRWVVSAARRPAEPPENPRRDRWALLLCALTALLFVLAFKGTALYGTVWILILAGVLHFFTTPYNPLYQSLQKLSSELESVGSTLGIPPLRLIFDVLLPQCAGTLADMAAYFFVSSTVTISAAAFLFHRLHAPAGAAGGAVQRPAEPLRRGVPVVSDSGGQSPRPRRSRARAAAGTAVKIPLDAVGNSWYHQLVPGKWF